MLEHPEITMANRTGYPSWSQEANVEEEVVRCCECGRKMDVENEDVYECRTHKTLCLDCLMMLHKKYIFR